MGLRSGVPIQSAKTSLREPRRGWKIEPTRLPGRAWTHLSISTSLSLYIYIYINNYTYNYKYIDTCVYIYIYRSIYISIYLSIDLSIYLSMSGCACGQAGSPHSTLADAFGTAQRIPRSPLARSFTIPLILILLPERNPLLFCSF